MNKTELRQRLQQARQSLPNSERFLKSKQICERLEKIDWSNTHTIHCYEPIEKLGEVDVSTFMTMLKTHHPHIKFYTSRKIDGIWETVSRRDDKVDKITQPSSLKLDTIIVPMLGFDSKLHRLGHGGGYYDRLLAIQNQAQKIGVCFEQGRVSYIQVEPHDIQLDIIVTETNIYKR
jgi:5-formyltetrahydrofolate cyclo-ligase